MSYRRKLFAILFRSRVIDVRTRWNSIFCRVARISMSLLSVPSGERERKVKGRRRKATSMFHDLTSLRFFLRVSDTINIDTEFYLRFHTFPRKSREWFSRGSICINKTRKCWDTCLKTTDGYRFKFIGLSKLNWHFFR